MFKQVMFFIILVLIPLCLLGGATVLQTIPYGLAAILAYNHIWNKKNMTVAIIVLSAIMFMINMIGEPSTLDCVIWFFFGTVWALEK
jgi:branched-subunit amino acid transport protein